MRKTPGPSYFLEEGSDQCRRVQEALTCGRFRCHLMMVADASQAAAILRHSQDVPDLILIFGGLDDGRAAELLEKLGQDARLSAIRYPVLVDSLQALEQFAPRGDGARPLRVFPLEAIGACPGKGGERLFSWLMARFS